MSEPQQKAVELHVALRPQLALDLAQFIKRITFGGARECAADDDEAYRMLDALAEVRRELERKGYAPR